VMERLAGGRRCKLINRRFVVEARHGEIIAERAIANADELREIIDESFKMTLPAPAAEIFCRTAS